MEKQNWQEDLVELMVNVLRPNSNATLPDLCQLVVDLDFHALIPNLIVLILMFKPAHADGYGWPKDEAQQRDLLKRLIKEELDYLAKYGVV